MNKPYPIFLFLLAIIFILPLPGQSQRIPTGPGPEDMVIDQSHPGGRLLIACASRRASMPEYGEIEFYIPQENLHGILIRKNEPDQLVFRPHGIAYAESDGIPYLYVISHDELKQQHPILRYRISGKTLEYDRQFNHELLVSPNALTVLSDGGFLVCNDARVRGKRLEQILSQKTGNIVYCNGDDTYTIAAAKLGMPAGLNHQGSTVYVSCATGNSIYRYQLQDGILSQKELLCKIKGPDNIRFDADQLLVCAHVSMVKFLQHINDGNKPSPTNVYRIEPRTGRMEVLYHDAGNTISAGSVAIRHNGHYFLGQIFDDFILSVTN